MDAGKLARGCFANTDDTGFLVDVGGISKCWDRQKKHSRGDGEHRHE